MVTAGPPIAIVWLILTTILKLCTLTIVQGICLSSMLIDTDLSKKKKKKKRSTSRPRKINLHTQEEHFIPKILGEHVSEQKKVTGGKKYEPVA